jgi:hypothetical protein
MKAACRHQSCRSAFHGNSFIATRRPDGKHGLASTRSDHDQTDNKTNNIGYRPFGSGSPFRSTASHIVALTIGWPVQFLLVIGMFFVNVLGLIACFEHGFRLWVKLSLVYLLVVSLCTLPLAISWYFHDREAKRIVSWMQAEYTRTGGYPDDLSGYTFLRPEYKEHFSYSVYQYNDDGINSTVKSFEMRYTVISLSFACHRYNSQFPEDGWQLID